MKIGFVIVNYNDGEHTKKLIDNIKDYKCISHIVVVDNNSNDHEKELINKIKCHKLTVLEQEENKGYAYALNIGAKYITNLLGECLICLSNTDIRIPDEEVIKKLANMIDEDTKCVMPKVKENNHFTYGWRLTNSLTDLMLNIPLINRPFRKKYIYYQEEYFKSKEAVIDVIYGCFFMIESNTLKAVNYFDDKVFLYYEEYILAHKLKNINKLSKVNTSIYIEHLHNATIGTNMSKLKKYKVYKSSQMYYEKTIIMLMVSQCFYLEYFI